MANQQQIDNLSVEISLLINKAREELIFDLYKLSQEINDEVLFLKAINELDVADLLRKKLGKATILYANAHRHVLESTIGFAQIEAGTLSSFISLNQSVLDNAVINTVAAHIRNEVAKGMLAGVSPQAIAESVAKASISTAQIETLMNTSLSTYGRMVTNQMMKVAPSKTKYIYIGPLDDRTRDDCLEYAGAGAITEAEIISNGWEASLSDGGGFNCRHKWEIASEEGIKFFEGDKVNA
jgi:hypothetical protein